ncbi:hypothetical protein [Planctobacterium marinum]|uniref:Uncharacterized protein n=1 Tax=Planctobacterium marinum TaxID=1631968 RepID=A0AA48HIG1_9ALTE|nr:hypothetical protein MACH26_30290 [Planctobacterium marinum]
MKGWKFLFWLFALLLFIDFVTLPFSDDIGLWSFVGLVFGCVALIPYYGYAYQVSIGSIDFWRAMFLIQVALVIISIYDPVIANLLHVPNLENVLIAFVMVLILCLVFIPAYRYAFRSGHLWAAGI